MLDKLVGSLIKVGATFTKSFLAPLATMASASAINYAIQRKMHGKGVVRAGKRITLLFWNEDIDDIIGIIKSLENLGVLIDAVKEAVKHETKKQERGFFGVLLGTLGTPMLRNTLTGKGVLRPGREYNNMDKIF